MDPAPEAIAPNRDGRRWTSPQRPTITVGSFDDEMLVAFARRVCRTGELRPESDTRAPVMRRRVLVDPPT